jgi:hypothetical protein
MVLVPQKVGWATKEPVDLDRFIPRRRTSQAPNPSEAMLTPAREAIISSTASDGRRFALSILRVLFRFFRGFLPRT